MWNVGIGCNVLQKHYVQGCTTCVELIKDLSHNVKISHKEALCSRLDMKERERERERENQTFYRP